MTAGVASQKAVPRASLLVGSRTRAVCSGGADTLRFAPLSSRALNAPALKDALLMPEDGGGSEHVSPLRALPLHAAPHRTPPAPPRGELAFAVEVRRRRPSCHAVLASDRTSSKNQTLPA